VVVRRLGGDLHTNYAAVGQTVHLAARLEQMARPGSIFAGTDTVRLAQPWVEAKALGPVKIKGLEAPVEVFEVVGVGAPRSRLQAAATAGLTPFVGRETELDGLRDVLEQVREESRVVALVGEAEVGKSRVPVRARLARRLPPPRASRSPGASTAYRPVESCGAASGSAHR
jgi:hypothetical protein